MIIATDQKCLLWASVSAPEVPQWILDETLDHIGFDDQNLQTSVTNSLYSDDYKQRDLYKDGETYKTAFNHCQYLSQPAYRWILDNVSDLAKDLRVSFTLPGRSRCGPHTDGTRDYTLIYLLKPGGPNHSTVFWQQKDQPDILRPRRHTVDHYDQLTRLAAVQVPVKTWTLLNGRVLHSVEDIEQGRVALQCSFDHITALALSDIIYA